MDISCMLKTRTKQNVSADLANRTFATTFTESLSQIITFHKRIIFQVYNVPSPSPFLTRNILLGLQHTTWIVVIFPSQVRKPRNSIMAKIRIYYSVKHTFIYRVRKNGMIKMIHAPASIGCWEVACSNIYHLSDWLMIAVDAFAQAADNNRRNSTNFLKIVVLPIFWNHQRSFGHIQFWDSIGMTQFYLNKKY